MPRSPFFLGNRLGQVNPEVRAAGSERAYPFQRGLATKMQNGATHAELTAALQQQTLELRNRGIPISSLPALHGQMSTADMEDYQRRLNQLGGTADTPNRTAAGQPITPASQPAQASPSPAVPAVPSTTSGRSPKADEGVTGAWAELSQPAPASPAVPAVPAGQSPKDVSKASNPMDDVRPAVSTGSPSNPPPSANQPAGNTMDQIMHRDGTVAPGQHLIHTGAGLSTTAQSETGARSVAISPTGHQALENAFDGPARAQFNGRGWNQLSPDERKQVIMGSDFFHRTEAPGGMTDGGRMYDPTLDTTKDRTVSPDGSISVSGKYGTGSSTGAIPPSPVPPTSITAPPVVAKSETAAPVPPSEPAEPLHPDVNPNLASRSRTSYLTGGSNPMDDAFEPVSASPKSAIPASAMKPVLAAANPYTGAAAQERAAAYHPIPAPGTDITSQGTKTKAFDQF